MKRITNTTNIYFLGIFELFCSLTQFLSDCGCKWATSNKDNIFR